MFGIAEIPLRLKKKILSIKEYYLKKSPKGKWMFVRNIGIFILRLTGVAILDPDFEIHWHSYSSALTGVNFLISFLYTLRYWYQADETLRALQAIPLFGVVVPSLLVYALIMIPSKRPRFQKLIFFAGDKIYTEHGQSNANYIKVTDESAIQLFMNTAKIIGMITVSMTIFCIFPIYAFIYRNEIQFPVPVLIPFTTLDTKIGLLVNVLNQAFTCLIGITGNYGIEIIACILKNTVWASASTICYSLDELTELLHEPEQREKKIMKTKYQLRNTLVQIQDFDRYILEICDLYYWKFFVQPYLLTFAISGALFFYLYSAWLSGLGISFLCMAQLFILCDIGNEVEKAKELVQAKLCEIPWHLMTPEQQKQIAHILNRLQNGAVIQMGPLAEINYGTFADMCKTIYSLLMMMINRLNA